MVYFKHDDMAGAVREFEAALADASVNDPLLHYRLGRLYAVSGRTARPAAPRRSRAKRGENVTRAGKRSIGGPAEAALEDVLQPKLDIARRVGLAADPPNVAGALCSPPARRIPLD